MTETNSLNWNDELRTVRWHFCTFLREREREILLPFRFRESILFPLQSRTCFSYFSSSCFNFFSWHLRTPPHGGEEQKTVEEYQFLMLGQNILSVLHTQPEIDFIFLNKSNQSIKRKKIEKKNRNWKKGFFFFKPCYRL